MILLILVTSQLTSHAHHIMLMPTYFIKTLFPSDWTCYTIMQGNVLEVTPLKAYHAILKLSLTSQSQSSINGGESACVSDSIFNTVTSWVGSVITFLVKMLFGGQTAGFSRQCLIEHLADTFCIIYINIYFYCTIASFIHSYL